MAPHIVTTASQCCNSSCQLQGLGDLCALTGLRHLNLGVRCRFATRHASTFGAALSRLTVLTQLEVRPIPQCSDLMLQLVVGCSQWWLL